MNPIKLTLLSTALMATTAFGQSLDISNFPTNVNFQNWASQVNGFGNWDLGSQPLTKELTFNYGPSYSGVDYSSTNGNYKTGIRIADQGGTKIVIIELRDTTISYPSENRLARTVYYGPSLTNLTMYTGFDAGIQNPYGFSSPPPSSFGPNNFVNGLNAEGTAPIGGAGLSGGSTVFIEQAEALNVGLSFTNGQWVPAP